MSFTSIEVPDDRCIVDASMAEFALSCVTAASSLGIYDALVSGPMGSKALATKLGLHASTLDVLCRVLTSRGELTWSENGFGLADSTHTYWVSQSPLYRGAEFAHQMDHPSHHRIVQAAQQGTVPLLDAKTSLSEAWESGRISQGMAESFTHLMHSIILAPAIAASRSTAFQDVQHLLDVGGGSGAFCMAVVANNPAVQATILDLPQVCNVAMNIVAAEGLDDRIDAAPCNFFSESWPKTGDAALLSNILHDWPLDKCRQLLSSARASLPSGGRIFIHEALLTEDTLAPLATVVLDLMVYMTHRSQQFTFNQLEALLLEAGFENPKPVHHFGYYTLVAAEAS